MFKPRSDSVRIGQDSLLIPSKNGNQFVPGNVLRFDLERNIGFGDLANSYLEFNVDIGVPNQAQNDTQPCMMLDPLCGANNLIERLTLRSQGVVLEELAGYSLYANVHYNATNTEGNRNKRCLLEGCAESRLIQDNPYVAQNSAVTAADTPDGTTGLVVGPYSWKYQTRKVAIPLLGGVFTNPRAFPLLAMPLEVEIIMNDAVKCLRLCELADSVGCDDTGGGAQNFLNVTNRQTFNSIGGGTDETPQVPVQGEGLINSVKNFPFRCGQVVRLAGGGSLIPGNYTIAAIEQYSSAHGTAGDRNKIRVQFTVDIDGGGGPATGVSIHSLAADGNPLAEHGAFGYSINEPRLVIQKVVPPPQEIEAITRAVSKGNYSQDIVSWTEVNNAIPASQTASTNIIATDLTKVKSILSVPTTQAVDLVTNSNSLQGLYLDADRYVYQINNKIVPDRRVSLVREQFPTLRAVAAEEVDRPYKLGNYHSGYHLYEAEKALRSANINVQELGFLTKNNAIQNADRVGSWFVGRSLASGVGSSQNLVAKSVLLYLDYRTTSNMVKLLHNFMVHIRTISIGIDGVALFY